MRGIVRALLLACLSFDAVPALASPEAVVTPLVAKDLPELQGKEGVMILVEYPPGASDPILRQEPGRPDPPTSQVDRRRRGGRPLRLQRRRASGVRARRRYAHHPHGGP